MRLERIPSGRVSGPFVDNRHSRAGGNPLDVRQKSEPDAEGYVPGFPPSRERRAGFHLRNVLYHYETE